MNKIYECKFMIKSIELSARTKKEALYKAKKSLISDARNNEFWEIVEGEAGK